MILRRRHPDGTDTSIDMGGGPFGDTDVRLVQWTRNPVISGVLAVNGERPKPGLSLVKAEANRRQRAQP